MFSCEFCEIYKNTFFEEHHQTTANVYSSISSGEGGIGKRNCELWYRNQSVPILGRSASHGKGQSR